MSAPRLGVIVFARMSSQRLPGKVLLDFAGRPLLAHMLARAAAVAQPVIVATSDQPEDAAVAELARACGALSFRGSLHDVLQRAVDCAHEFRLDAFARLCGDRPYFPQQQMRDALAAMAASLVDCNPADLITNHVPQTPPPGLSTEVVRVAALERALAGGATTQHREHLTSYLYDHAQAFDIWPVAADHRAVRGQRFAVDTADDHRLLSAAARQLADLHATFEMAGALLPRTVATANQGRIWQQK